MTLTLILELDLDMVKIYLHIKNEVYVKWLKSYSLNRQTDGQTDGQRRLKTLPTCIHGW